MSWNNIKTTIYKELRGIIRDKKSIQKLILYPLLIPLIILLFGVLFDSVSESQYTVGINYTLSEEEKVIIEKLENIKTEYYEDKSKLEKSYKEGNIQGYIVKTDNTYTIYSDSSQNSGEIVYSLANTYLENYNTVLGNKYLIEQGIDPTIVFNSIVIENKSLTKDESNLMSNVLFSMVIAYIIMIVVMVCVVVVTDATSGEKERGTLETILTFPIRSSELIVGKYAATTILSSIVGVISYLLSIPTLAISKQIIKSYEDISFNTNIVSIIMAIIVIFLAALLSSGVCMALSGKAKTYKEAQSSLQFISILPMIPYFLNFMEIDGFIFNLIPIANCSSLLSDIVISSINYNSLMIIILSTIIYIVLILFYISKQYKKEETLFS